MVVKLFTCLKIDKKMRQRTMIALEQLHQEINKLPQEAQLLLIDFIQLLKKRYNQAETGLNTLSFQNRGDKNVNH